MTVEKKRIQFIDLAKGICILQIVILHCLQPLEKDIPVLEFLGYLRMPLYFCLSGLFYKDYGNVNFFFLKKINKILITFVGWFFIGYALLYTRNFIFSTPSPAENDITAIFYGNHFFNNPLWFLLSLFWCNIIFRIINEWSKIGLLQFSIVLFLTLIGIFMSFNGITNFLYLGTSLTCLPFFYMGYVLGSFFIFSDQNSVKRDFSLMCCGLAFITIMSFLPIQIPYLKYHLNSFTEGYIILYYLFSSIMVISVILMCKFIKKIPFISYLGKYSIIVLVTHILIIYIANGCLTKFSFFEIYKEYLPVLDIFIVCLSMFLVIPACRRFLPYICAQKELIKARIEEKKLLAE